MTAELLACPFCGGEAARHWGEHSFNDAIIRCTECYAEGAIFDVDDCGEDESGRNEADAIAAWNRRAIPAAPSDVAAIYVPMPLNADGDGPADRAETVRVEHQIWDAQTNTTLFTASDEAVAQHIVALWNGDAAALIESLSHDREVMREALERIVREDIHREGFDIDSDKPIVGDVSRAWIGPLGRRARAALASLKGGA
jgi:Lar family restriction alleviation protein